MSRTLLRATSLILFIGLSFSISGQAYGQELDSPPDLSGTWVKELVLTSTYRIALVTRFTNRATTYLLLKVVQEGTDISIENEVCRIDMEDSAPGFRPELPDAFLRTLPKGQRQGSVRWEDGQYRLHIDRGWDIQGARLRDPNRESLPESADDPRVFDQEGDGYPGFTVHIHGPLGGSIHLARRNWDIMEGPILSSSRVEGDVEWQSEQNVLEASRRILRTSPTTTPDLDRSTFRMVRVASTTTCTEVARRGSQFF